MQKEQLANEQLFNKIAEMLRTEYKTEGNAAEADAVIFLTVQRDPESPNDAFNTSFLAGTEENLINALAISAVNGNSEELKQLILSAASAIQGQNVPDTMGGLLEFLAKECNCPDCTRERELRREKIKNNPSIN
jgi:hypothetical protein